MYISTEDVFPSKRLHQLAKTILFRYTDYTLGHLKFEDNIFVEHIADYVCSMLPIFLLYLSQTFRSN